LLPVPGPTRAASDGSALSLMVPANEALPVALAPPPRRRVRVSLSWWPRSFPPLVPTLIVIFFVVCGVFGPTIAPYSLDQTDFTAVLKPPFWLPGGSMAHLLGTDQLGRDILTRLLHGSQLSLILAVCAVAGAGAIGVALGIVAGQSRGFLSALIMRVVDAFLALPFFLVAMAFVAALGVSTTNIIIVMALTTWPPFTRIVRAEALRIRESDYVALAKIAGVPSWRIAIEHILPNVLNGVIVMVTIDFGRVVLLESGLSFLGLGVQPPAVSWGLLLADGKNFMTLAWWLTVMPGLALLFTVLAFNMLGDWLRDRLDPRLG
jgi:peptide/nickel transport system permease protein